VITYFIKRAVTSGATLAASAVRRLIFSSVSASKRFTFAPESPLVSWSFFRNSASRCALYWASSRSASSLACLSLRKHEGRQLHYWVLLHVAAHIKIDDASDYDHVYIILQVMGFIQDNKWRSKQRPLLFQLPCSLGCSSVGYNVLGILLCSKKGLNATSVGCAHGDAYVESLPTHDEQDH